MEKTAYEKLRETVAEAFAKTIRRAADKWSIKNYAIRISRNTASIVFDRRRVDVSFYDCSSDKFKLAMNWSSIGSVRYGDADLDYAKMIGIVASQLGKLAALLNVEENLKLLADIRAAD